MTSSCMNAGILSRRVRETLKRELQAEAGFDGGSTVCSALRI